MVIVQVSDYIQEIAYNTWACYSWYSYLNASFVNWYSVQTWLVQLCLITSKCYGMMSCVDACAAAGGTTSTIPGGSTSGRQRREHPRGRAALCCWRRRWRRNHLHLQPPCHPLQLHGQEYWSQEEGKGLCVLLFNRIKTFSGHRVYEATQRALIIPKNQTKMPFWHRESLRARIKGYLHN